MIAKLIIDKTLDWPHALKYDEFLHSVVAYYRAELKVKWDEKVLDPYSYNRGVSALNICLGKSLEDIIYRHTRAVKRFLKTNDQQYIRVGLDNFQLSYGKVIACLRYAYGLEQNPTTKVKELCDAILAGKDVKKLQHETKANIPNNKAPKSNRRQ
jgi:hypothetical protein